MGVGVGVNGAVGVVEGWEADGSGTGSATSMTGVTLFTWGAVECDGARRGVQRVFGVQNGAGGIIEWYEGKGSSSGSATSIPGVTWLT